MHRVLLAAVFALVLISAAAGQDNPAPPQTAEDKATLPSPAVEQAKPYLPQKETYRVFVLGDSLAAGMGLGLARITEGDQRLVVDGRYKEDSGLARPEFYDWNDALPKILESNEMDVAVILIGANDSRDIRSGEMRYVFGSQEWTNAYVAQIDRLIDGLKQAGAAIYWVELPPMQATKYDAALKAITIVQRERVKQKGVRFIDTVKAFLGPDGKYTAAGFDDTGQLRRMRDSDGVHFHKVGNNKLAGFVLKVIREDIAAAAAQPKTPEPVAATQPATPDDTIFRQGPVIAADSVVLPPVSEVVTGPPAPLTHEQVMNQAVPGSATEKLFKYGEAPTPQPGRFDDFSAPQ